MVPVLKWVRGEPLSQDNWVELFHLIGLPKSMTLEKLTFGDIIAHSEGIINNADALKVGAHTFASIYSFSTCRIFLMILKR